jgi:hypothetical protein
VRWLEGAEGRAVKVIHVLLRHLPGDREYRVIFIRRDMKEVVASQRAMLNGTGRSGAAIPDDKLAAVFERQLLELREWLAVRPNFRVLYLSYRKVLEDPLAAAQKISAFVDRELDTAAMAMAVDRALYRQRSG